MARTASTMAPIGMELPPFRLTDVTSGETVSHEDFSGAAALLVVFLCNHCPYVKHVRPALAAFARAYVDRGLQVVGICSNDAEAYPDDGPAGMRAEAREAGYVFPYLFDESQEVAKGFAAACTPDFYLFGPDLRLAYRGQFDGSRPGNGVAVTGEDLRRAADEVLSGREPAREQVPSLGCNIKWKPGNAPGYFG